MHISNPAFDYDKYGQQYSGIRQTDPRIAAYVFKALEQAGTIVNIGAGAGSYEPADQYVVAVEPSAVMRSQRKMHHKLPAVIASAAALPFDDDAFDAAMAILTVHHWPDRKKGLQELRRVAKHQVVVMTFDPDALDNFWNVHYFPEVIAVEKARYPSINFITGCLGGHCRVVPIPVPFDCADGFQEAFYGRPEAFLQQEVRAAQSAWGFIPTEQQQVLVKRLADDLASGEWDRKYGHYRQEPFFTCALRLIIATPE